MKVLDLFCGGGGAAKGYALAGFEVVGVDINHQPRYPYEFHQADALTYPLDGFDLIHASPPCKPFSTATKQWQTNHPNLLTPMVERLKRSDKWFVIENVPGAPFDWNLRLCGSSFSLGVRRHRLFQTNFVVDQPKCNHKAQGYVITVTGNPGGSSYRDNIQFGNLDDWCNAMQIDWLDSRTLSQAIPPAYTKYIGEQFLLEDSC